MVKKILVIVPFAMSKEYLARRKAKVNAGSLKAGMEFKVRPVRVVPANYSSQHDMALAEFSILDAGIDAEAQGFDSVCIDTMSDSGMSMLRSVLTIPVIAPGRHAMLLAQMLGDKFSILMMWSRWEMLYKKTLGDWGWSTNVRLCGRSECSQTTSSFWRTKKTKSFPFFWPPHDGALTWMGRKF